ncbi:MAG: HAD family phosphatase [Rubrivivax sp.]|nr:HAD family phosphatase [Rubrivivax sp.]
MSTLPPQALLFDLGGVLIEIDFERALQSWEPLSRLAPADMRRRFGLDEAYRRHERGEIDGAQYFAHLAARLELDASDDQIRAGWNSIFVGEITETTALVLAARARLPCSAFSNTNAVHLQAFSARFPAVNAAFDTLFLSHELACRKPERAAFDLVARRLGVAAPAILFFDDLADNVAAAIDAGLQAVLVRSPADVRQALLSRGLIA